MLKPRLTKIVEEVFAIGGNHQPAKDMELREKLIDFLKEEDHLILSDDDENIRLAKDVIHFIDADRLLAKTMNNKEAYHHVKPFLERLLISDSWHYDELRLLISSINFTENIEQAINLAAKAEERIFEFKRFRSTDILDGYLALNMCARILNAKYFDRDVKISLAPQFTYWLNKLKYLVESNKELELALLITKVRRDIFNRDESDIFTLCDDLIPRYDEKIGQMIRNEVDFYIEAGVFEKKKVVKEFELENGGEE